MNFRRLIIGLALTALGAGYASAAEQDRPNIILCMTDDQGWGDTGYNGHPELKTPELDAMAAAGIRFDRFYAANPLCTPTRASCLTGRSPVRYFCYSWGHDLPLREVTLAEAARKVGYATAHFGKWHLGGIPHAEGSTGRGPMKESLDPKPRHPGNQAFDNWFSAGNFYDIGYEHIYHNGKQVPPREGDTADVLMDEAIKWIGRQAGNGKPFLALVWFPSPHDPWKATPEYAEPYEKYGEEKANYYGELAAVDHNMGRLRHALREGVSARPQTPELDAEIERLRELLAKLRSEDDLSKEQLKQVGLPALDRLTMVYRHQSAQMSRHRRDVTQLLKQLDALESVLGELKSRGTSAAALPVDRLLAEAATGHSADMRQHGFFAHESPVPGKKTPWDRAKLAGTQASGENIFMGSSAAVNAVKAGSSAPRIIKKTMTRLKG